MPNHLNPKSLNETFSLKDTIKLLQPLKRKQTAPKRKN